MPLQERRRSRRIVTLRNATLAFAIALGVFIAISIYSELRPSRTAMNGGRLSTTRTVPVELPTTRVEQVPEEIIATDETAADPMLTDTLDEEQLLGVEEVPTTTVSPSETDGPPGGAPLLSRVPDPSRKKARFKISNESDGVKVEPQ